MTENTEMTTEAEAEVTVESSPTTESQPEQNSEVAEKPVNQEAVQKRINDITAQKYEEKQRADEAERQLDELKRNAVAPQAETTAPTQAQIEYPSDDLKYDDPAEYNRQVVEFNKNIAKQTFAEQQAATQTAERQRVEQEQARQLQQETQKAIIASASTHNVELSKVDAAAGILQQRGINGTLVDLLTQHESSAVLMTHLADNPAVFDDVNGLNSPYTIIRELDKLQTQAVQRKVTSAPEPVQTLSGMPAREQDHFEQICPEAQFK